MREILLASQRNMMMIGDEFGGLDIFYNLHLSRLFITQLILIRYLILSFFRSTQPPHYENRSQKELHAQA